MPAQRREPSEASPEISPLAYTCAWRRAGSSVILPDPALKCGRVNLQRKIDAGSIAFDAPDDFFSHA